MVAVAPLIIPLRPAVGTKQITSHDVVDTWCTSDTLADYNSISWSTSDTLEMYDSIPGNVQANLRTFLATGESECLNMNEDNFHYYCHMAWKLKYSSLIHACVVFLSRQTCVTRLLFDHHLNCDCKKILDLELQKLHDSKHSCPKTVPRKNDKPVFLVLFTCSEIKDNSKQISIFDLHTRNIFKVHASKWKKLDYGYAVCSLHIAEVPYILTSGGCGNVGKLYRYDVVMDKWDKNINLNNVRSMHVMCSVGEQIYLIGGRETSTVEVCNLDGSKCIDIGRLPVHVHNMAHVVFENKIYLFGGENKRGRVSAVQCIDIKSKTITRLKDLPCECSGGNAVVQNNRIFIATQQGHMIKFDPLSGQSELCNHQPFNRKHFSMFTQDGNVFLLGGVRTDGKEDSSCLLCKYSPDHNHWEKAATFASSMTIYASCAVQYPKTCPIIPFSSAI